MEEILRKLIAYPTVSGDKVAMHQLLTFVSEFLAQRGMHVAWFESDGYESIVATVKPDCKTPKVMLAAHADVVPAGEAMFTLRKNEGRYYGRGVMDMKFAIAAYLQIIDDIQADIQSYDIGIMITSDEEIGGANGVGMLVDHGYLPQVCILPDGGDNWQIQTRSKGLLHYRITTEGVSAHGSRPWLGDNAITKLLGILDEIAALFPKLPGPDTNTISLTKIISGTAQSQIPDAATMVIDIRTLDSREYDRINREVLAVCRAKNTSVELISEGSPTSFKLADPFIAPYAALITKYTGITVHGFFALGTSDARYFVPHGTPVVSVYPTGSGIHSDDEWIDAKAVEQFQVITKEYLQHIAKSTPR